MNERSSCSGAPIIATLFFPSFFPKKHGFFGYSYEILILKIVFFSIFAIFCWKNQ